MACTVKINRHKRLALRLYWNGIESWEGTGLKDILKNRQRLEARAVLISEEMERGEFDYLKWFPEGNKAALFRPKQVESTIKGKTIGEFYAEWIQTKRTPLVRASLERDYHLCFDHYILPQLKDVALSGLTFAKLQGFQIHLVEEKKLSVKTARNIIDGCFRALMRDARKQGIVKREAIDDAFQLTWPRLSLPAPDPFTTEERDKILGYFRAKTSAVDHSFLLTLFWTGMRPSEAIALRWSDVDLGRGKASITKSRHMKAEAPTKTRASVRTASLLPAVVEALQQIYPLHATENDYVFHDGHGVPLDAQEWMWKHWNRALRASGVRQRKFYNTRHTYISTALTAGVNLKWISEQTGTSIRMIEERYGRYIQNDGDAALRTLSEAKTETFTETFEGERGKSGKRLVVPTGIEPATRKKGSGEKS